jgi:hypothetical protein
MSIRTMSYRRVVVVECVEHIGGSSRVESSLSHCYMRCFVGPSVCFLSRDPLRGDQTSRKCNKISLTEKDEREKEKIRVRISCATVSIEQQPHTTLHTRYDPNVQYSGSALLGCVTSGTCLQI